MVIYLDILFLNNTLMTYAIIWAVAKILGYKSRWWRLLLAAILGTFYSLIIIYIDTLVWSDYYRYMWYIFLNITTAVLIIYISFGKISFPEFLKALGYLYLISFICIGAILSIIYIFGIEQINEKRTYIFLGLGFLLLIMLGNKGWKIFHSYLIPDDLLIPVNIYFKNKKVTIKGLIDTGNSLNDPLTNIPVIITEFRYILALFPFELKNILSENKGGIIKIVNLFADNNLGNRVRVLPFSDLGQEHGMLVGFRPDKIEILYKEKQISKENILIALTDHILDDDNSYQALVNPRIIKI